MSDYEPQTGDIIGDDCQVHNIVDLIGGGTSTGETPQPPTLEERLSALERLEIERIMGGVD